MKVMPTLEGGLRLDTEVEADWDVLRAIVQDATIKGDDLATQLGALVSEEAGKVDWMELVVPDLREAFQDELAEVGAAIETAAFHASGGPGPLWISRHDGAAWYSALNQARLALEEIHKFGPEEKTNPNKLSPISRNALVRSRFYCAIQGLLLDYVMK